MRLKRRIVNMTTGEVYESVKYVKFNLPGHMGIDKAVAGGTRCKGNYWRYEDEELRIKNTPKQKTKKEIREMDFLAYCNYVLSPDFIEIEDIKQAE